MPARRLIGEINICDASSILPIGATPANRRSTSPS